MVSVQREMQQEAMVVQLTPAMCPPFAENEKNEEKKTNKIEKKTMYVYDVMKIWIPRIQAFMPHESSGDSPNLPDGPMGSPRHPL